MSTVIKQAFYINREQCVCSAWSIQLVESSYVLTLYKRSDCQTVGMFELLNEGCEVQQSEKIEALERRAKRFSQRLLIEGFVEFSYAELLKETLALDYQAILRDQDIVKRLTYADFSYVDAHYYLHIIVYKNHAKIIEGKLNSAYTVSNDLLTRATENLSQDETSLWFHELTLKTIYFNELEDTLTTLKRYAEKNAYALVEENNVPAIINQGEALYYQELSDRKKFRQALDNSPLRDSYLPPINEYRLTTHEGDLVVNQDLLFQADEPDKLPRENEYILITGDLVVQGNFCIIDKSFSARRKSGLIVLGDIYADNLIDRTWANLDIQLGGRLVVKGIIYSEAPLRWCSNKEINCSVFLSSKSSYSIGSEYFSIDLTFVEDLDASLANGLLTDDNQFNIELFVEKIIQGQSIFASDFDIQHYRNTLAEQKKHLKTLQECVLFPNSVSVVNKAELIDAYQGKITASKELDLLKAFPITGTINLVYCQGDLSIAGDLSLATLNQYVGVDEDKNLMGLFVAGNLKVEGNLLTEKGGDFFVTGNIQAKNFINQHGYINCLQTLDIEQSIVCYDYAGCVDSHHVKAREIIIDGHSFSAKQIDSDLYQNGDDTKTPNELTAFCNSLADEYCFDQTDTDAVEIHFLFLNTILRSCFVPDLVAEDPYDEAALLIETLIENIKAGNEVRSEEFRQSFDVDQLFDLIDQQKDQSDTVSIETENSFSITDTDLLSINMQSELQPALELVGNGDPEALAKIIIPLEMLEELERSGGDIAKKLKHFNYPGMIKKFKQVLLFCQTTKPFLFKKDEQLRAFYMYDPDTLDVANVLGSGTQAVVLKKEDGFFRLGEGFYLNDIDQMINEGQLPETVKDYIDSLEG